MQYRVLLIIFILGFFIAPESVTARKGKSPSGSKRKLTTASTHFDSSTITLAGAGELGSDGLAGINESQAQTLDAEKVHSSSPKPSTGPTSTAAVTNILAQVNESHSSVAKTVKPRMTRRSRYQNGKHSASNKTTTVSLKTENTNKLFVGNDTSDFQDRSLTPTVETTTFSNRKVTQKLRINTSVASKTGSVAENVDDSLTDGAGSATTEDHSDKNDLEQEQPTQLNASKSHLEEATKPPGLRSTKPGSSRPTSKPADKSKSTPKTAQVEDISDYEASEGLEADQNVALPIDSPKPTPPNQQDSPQEAEPEHEEENESPAAASNPQGNQIEQDQQQHSYESNDDENSWLPGSSSFMAYFLIGSAIVFSAYFAYHYRSRIAGRCFACLVEGRRKGRSTGARQRQRSSNNRHHSGSGSESVTVEYKPLRTATDND